MTGDPLIVVVSQRYARRDSRLRFPLISVCTALDMVVAFVLAVLYAFPLDMVHRMTALDARTTSETLEGTVICTGVNPNSYLGAIAGAAPDKDAVQLTPVGMCVDNAPISVKGSDGRYHP